MIKEDNITSILSRMQSFPRRLKQVAQGVMDQNKLDTKRKEWTCRQIIHHIADGQINGYIRMKLTFTEASPMLKTFEQDKWVTLADNNMDVHLSLQLIESLYARWVTFMQSVLLGDWQRVAHHPDHGQVTLYQLLKGYHNHGENHLKQIEEMLS